MDYEELFKMCSELIELQKQHYEIVKREIEGIINKKIRNENYIERKLDEMLDILSFYENEEILSTFKKLCRYYLYINPQATVDYINFYKEQHNPEELESENKGKSEKEKSREGDIER